MLIPPTSIPLVQGTRQALSSEATLWEVEKQVPEEYGQGKSLPTPSIQFMAQIPITISLYHLSEDIGLHIRMDSEVLTGALVSVVID